MKNSKYYLNFCLIRFFVIKIFILKTWFSTVMIVYKLICIQIELRKKNKKTLNWFLKKYIFDIRTTGLKNQITFKKTSCRKKKYLFFEVCLIWRGKQPQRNWFYIMYLKKKKGKEYCVAPWPGKFIPWAINLKKNNSFFFVSF